MTTLFTENHTLEQNVQFNSSAETLTGLGSLHTSQRRSRYALKWRQKQLLVNLAEGEPCAYPAHFWEQQWLVDCLKRSPIDLVKLPPEFSQVEMEFWADACISASKAAFLQVPCTNALPRKTNRLKWWLKRTVEWAIAAILLLIASPIMLVLSCLISITSPGPILFSQWRVGERGKLFRILKFRTMVTGAEQMHHQVMGDQPGLHKCENDPRITPLGCWMRKYSLDELPQLINVLKGDMSLVGPRPWALYDAVRLSPDVRHRLNALPGITGIWQITRRATLRDIDAVNRIDLGYLGKWSFRQDLKILILTIPKVISGFGAY